MNLQIEHQPDRHRFLVVVDGHECVCEYRLAGAVMTITHTGVDPALEGRGIGGALVKAAFAHARAQHLAVDPACSYAQAYVERHPEIRDLLA